MVGRISARGLWVNIAGKSVCVPQPQGGVGSFPRARARGTYLWLAYEGDGRSISRSHGRQWRRDDESAWNQFYALLILSIRNLTAIQRTVDTFTTEILTVPNRQLDGGEEKQQTHGRPLGTKLKD